MDVRRSSQTEEASLHTSDTEIRFRSEHLTHLVRVHSSEVPERPGGLIRQWEKEPLFRIVESPAAVLTFKLSELPRALQEVTSPFYRWQTELATHRVERVLDTLLAWQPPSEAYGAIARLEVNGQQIHLGQERLFSEGKGTLFVDMDGGRVRQVSGQLQAEMGDQRIPIDGQVIRFDERNKCLRISEQQCQRENIYTPSHETIERYEQRHHLLVKLAYLIYPEMPRICAQHNASFVPVPGERLNYYIEHDNSQKERFIFAVGVNYRMDDPLRLALHLVGNMVELDMNGLRRSPENHERAAIIAAVTHANAALGEYQYPPEDSPKGLLYQQTVDAYIRGHANQETSQREINRQAKAAGLAALLQDMQRGPYPLYADRLPSWTYAEQRSARERDVQPVRIGNLEEFRTLLAEHGNHFLWGIRVIPKGEEALEPELVALPKTDSEHGAKNYHSMLTRREDSEVGDGTVGNGVVGDHMAAAGEGNAVWYPDELVAEITRLTRQTGHYMTPEETMDLVASHLRSIPFLHLPESAIERDSDLLGNLATGPRFPYRLVLDSDEGK
ncbi:MAG: hypothetical protein J2P37_26160 [Ktedonobacteraceae bacterium]|nr:hypothetical protein [Ktedonobacteraceae bacterium]